MKTILIPTDFSKNATHALNYAIDLAQHENAKIILLHSYHIDYTNGYVSANLIEKEVKDAEQNSATHLKSLYTKVIHAGNIQCECVSRQDLAVDAILTTIKEKNVDLVVMGTKGASGVTGAIFGSNTARVIEKATCPVIAVPAETPGLSAHGSTPPPVLAAGASTSRARNVRRTGQSGLGRPANSQQQHCSWQQC